MTPTIQTPTTITYIPTRRENPRIEKGKRRKEKKKRAE